MLVGNRVVLRTLQEADIPKIYEESADARHMGGFYPVRMPSQYNFERRFKESGLWSEEYGFLVICDHEGHILGQINHFKAMPYLDGLEIGYRIYRQENWRKGYTGEAVSMFVPYLFASRKISRIQACVLAENLGSRGVLEKNGFTYEGNLRKAVFHNGVVMDILIYSILREESKPIADVLKPL